MTQSPRAAVIVAVVVIAFSTLASTVRAASFTSVASGRWSDPATWARSTTTDATLPQRPSFPGPGDDVFIAAGTIVILDTQVGDARVTTVRVQSRAVLTCPRNADVVRSTPKTSIGLTVTTLRVERNGCFSCGFGDCNTDAEPFAGKFVLRLASNVPPANADENVRTFMVDSGGAVFLHGAPRVRPLTRLVQDADAGDTILTVADSDIFAASRQHGGWLPGERVVIAPTSANPDQTEYGIIKSTSLSNGTSSLTLVDPLKYPRNGKELILTNQADGNRRIVVDARAEILLLSRNIVIEGINDVVSGLGGDFMIAGDNVRARLSWVEFRYLGRRGQLARYPLHIHNLGDSGHNVYIGNVAIHSTFQRGIVVHCTNGVMLANNTVAGSPGFAYMLEDGTEEKNSFIGNFAIDVKPADYPLIQTERVNSAAFWFINSANTFVANVAAGIAGVGFSLDMDPVLNARFSTLSTCPERLPGYDPKLARENSSDFNRAVTLALIKKNFVRFDDNVVHSAHSGLWMSYPFTPMLVVERPAPISRLVVWNIAPRPWAPLPLDMLDGIALQFDGSCIRMQGQRGMHVYRMTCINSHISIWASCLNTFSGTTIAWLDSSALKHALPSDRFTTSGVIVAHSEPQVLLRTQVLGAALLEGPLIATAAKGSPLATLNTINGLSLAGHMHGGSPLIQLNAGDLHVFTDIAGETFGAGPGAVVAATYYNSSGVDPLIEMHAPGKCATGTYAPFNAWPRYSKSILQSGRLISVNAGLPMLCTGPALRFVGLSVALASNTQRYAPEIELFAPVADFHLLRRTNSFPVLLPLNAASTDPVYGGYLLRLSSNALTWTAATKSRLLEIAITPTVYESDAMTFHIAGLPPRARASQPQPGGVSPTIYEGISASCRQIVHVCSMSSMASQATACVCVVSDSVGEIVVRIKVGPTPRPVGLYKDNGHAVGVYDFPTFTIELD